MATIIQKDQKATRYPRQISPMALPWVMFQFTTEADAPISVPTKRDHPVVLAAPTVMEHTIMKDSRPHSPRQCWYVSRVSGMKANMAHSAAPRPTLMPKRMSSRASFRIMRRSLRDRDATMAFTDGVASQA